MKHLALRREIIAACQDMNRRGINQGTSGNISARVAGGLLITPSGVPYDETKSADIVQMKLDGSGLAPAASSLRRDGGSEMADGGRFGDLAHGRRARPWAGRCRDSR